MHQNTHFCILTTRLARGKRVKTNVVPSFDHFQQRSTSVAYSYHSQSFSELLRASTPRDQTLVLPPILSFPLTHEELQNTTEELAVSGSIPRGALTV
jgi:hypothetical protein